MLIFCIAQNSNQKFNQTKLVLFCHKRVRFKSKILNFLGCLAQNAVESPEVGQALFLSQKERPKEAPF
jgi:hypothetical protein